VEAILVKYGDRNLQDCHRCHIWYCWLKNIFYS